MTHAQPLPQTSEPGLQSPGNFDTPRKPKVKKHIMNRFTILTGYRQRGNVLLFRLDTPKTISN